MFRITILAIIFTTILSCKQDNKISPKLDIHGKWNVYNALRNGKETNTLQNAYLDFDTAKLTVSSNIFPGGEPLPFAINENKISILAEPQISFTISELNRDSMTLKGSVGQFILELYTIRGDSLPSNEVVADTSFIAE